MEEKHLTPEESLNIIDKAISNFKVNYQSSARVFLLWGWMMTLSSISHFLILRLLQSREAYELMAPLSIGNWLVYILVTFLILYFAEKKADQKRKIYSYLDTYISKIWLVAGIAMFIATFISIQLDIVPPIILLLIAGIATTITGLLIKFKPLIVGGIAFFIFSLITLYVPSENTLLVTAGAIICGYLIPGYYLKSAE